nr:unnamed protein product [Callosobruchus analis]
MKGEYIVSALVEQVVHYNIHTSLFDVVLVGLCRFILLLFFYAILYVNHWIIISWPHSSQPVFEVLLVLTSFILAWGEAWFLDFRVIPQETNANRYLITATESERAPLIRSFMHRLPSVYTESVGNFYSPQVTPQGSLYRFEEARALQESWDLYQKKDWKLYKHADYDIVYTRPDSKGKKIFKLLAPVHVAAKYLLDELYYRVQDQPKWNSAVKESHKVQTIDEHTDITYHVGCEPTGGMIASRYCTILKHTSIRDVYKYTIVGKLICK